jgi:type I restriction enzyme S subunit
MSNLPKGWEKVSLKEVVEDMHQGINTVTENIEYYDNGIDILQAKHITSGYIDLSDPKKVSIEDYNKYKSKYQPQINHILLTNIGTIGKVLIVEENISFLIAWNIFLIKSNHSKINPYFLFHILKKYDIDKFYDKFLTGNATKFINKKFMGDIEICLFS